MTPHLAFGLVRGGKVVRAEVVVRNAEPEGIALVAVPTGWILVYAISSASIRGQGVFAVHLDHEGKLLGNKQIARGKGFQRGSPGQQLSRRARS